MSRSSVRSSNVAKAAPIFAALGDEMRLQLLGRLGSSGPQSITSLTSGTDVTRQAITKHLNVLASAGLVRDLRSGRERIWELEAKKLDEARRYLDDISKQWDEALERLRKYVEE
jgi:DNA-binding transcriptional ArsR family regulator